jgi:hypothetical protein
VSVGCTKSSRTLSVAWGFLIRCTCLSIPSIKPIQVFETGPALHDHSSTRLHLPMAKATPPFHHMSDYRCATLLSTSSALLVECPHRTNVTRSFPSDCPIIRVRIASHHMQIHRSIAKFARLGPALTCKFKLIQTLVFEDFCTF